MMIGPARAGIWVDEVREGVGRAQVEEDEAKSALSELEKLGPGGDGFGEKLSAFKTNVGAHASSEEQEVFPILRGQSADQLASLANAFEAAEAAAPTHPDPHGPESAAGNMLIGPFVAIVDKVRDALARR